MKTTCTLLMHVKLMGVCSSEQGGTDTTEFSRHGKKCVSDAIHVGHIYSRVGAGKPIFGKNLARRACRMRYVSTRCAVSVQPWPGTWAENRRNGG